MAQEILPGIPELHQLIAVWYFDQGKYDEAVLYTKKAMAHGLGKAEGLYKVALIYYRAGRIRETMKTLDQLLRLNPDHPMGLKLRSVLTRKIEKEK
jgi:tetratricopeptide (TPR) repeat protein